MNRFSNNNGFHISSVWHILTLIFAAIFIIIFLRGIQSVDNMTYDEQSKSLENVLRKNIVHCYAVEGTYPPSLDYLQKHYGLYYDEDKFYVDYTSIGSNIMPDITIIPKQEQ